MGGGYLVYMILGGIGTVVGMILSARLKSKFNHYSQVGLHSRLSGKEVAEKMLKDNGIYDVQVISVDGFLSDHYNPGNKTVNLSPDVFNGRRKYYGSGHSPFIERHYNRQGSNYFDSKHH